MEDLDYPSGRGADDVIPALTRRVAYLEGRLATTQGDLDAARRRIAAYAEADEILKAAVEERQMLTNEVRRLREERDALRTEPVLPSAVDRETAVIQEMRSLLLEIVRDARARELPA